MTTSTATLNQADIRILQHQRTPQYVAIFLLLGLLIPLLIFTILAVTEQKEDTGLFIYFGVIDLALLLLFYFPLRKLRIIKNTCETGLKIVYSGIVKDLYPKKWNRLVYNIDGHPIEVWAPSPLSGLTDTDSLLNTDIELSVFPLTKRKNIMLTVLYPEFSISETSHQLYSDKDREEFDEKNKAEPWASIKITIGIIAGMTALTWLIVGTKYLWLFLIFYTVILTLASIIIAVTTRQLKNTTEKLVITGTVSEVIRFKYKTSKHSPWRNSCWYRIGSELNRGYDNDEGSLKPGEYCRLEYYADKKGRRTSLFRITKL